MGGGFDKGRGEMVELNMGGKEMMSENGGLLYDNDGWIENDLFKEVGKGVDGGGSCEVSVDKGIVEVSRCGGGCLCGRKIV